MWKTNVKGLRKPIILTIYLKKQYEKGKGKGVIVMEFSWLMGSGGRVFVLDVTRGSVGNFILVRHIARVS